MNRSTRRGALVLVLSLLIVLAAAGIAGAAPPWQDVDTTLLAPYGLTESDLAGISEGYPDGTWRPFAGMTRGQFAKMAAAAGLIQGVGEGLFAPYDTITREQGAAIVARYLAKQLLTDVQAVYTEAEAAAVLAAFADAVKVGSALVKETAYAVEKGVLRGSNGQLVPTGSLSRLQGAALLVRSLDAPLIADDVMAFLGRALAYVQTNGKAAALTEFMDKTGDFYLRNGELYIFAYDLTSDGMCLCLPPEPTKVSTSLWDLQDDEGKYFIREFYEIVHTTGSGWSTYRYLNPSQGNVVQDKTAYIMKVDDTWFMGAGVYGLSR